MFDGGDALSGTLPSVGSLDRMGIYLDAVTIREIGRLNREVKRVLAGGAIPNVEIKKKVTCSNIMPFAYGLD